MVQVNKNKRRRPDAPSPNLPAVVVTEVRPDEFVEGTRDTIEYRELQPGLWGPPWL